MDPNSNAGKPDPVKPAPKPHDIAEPGPINPATGQPDHTAEVSALKGWFRENRGGLLFTVIAIALVIIYLDPIDTLKVVIGLGLVIFIHELGHFLAAKWCDVHVRTFSIGFGPAVPFCSYKWGETTYMVGIIPLGGYVAMVGEGDNPDEDGEEDPRSFRKKSVGQRMLIISAGVVMNIILGMACFVAAYMHGVKEKPATVGWIEGGGAAWRARLRTDDHIIQIGSRENPFFNDIRPIVMSTQKDEQVDVHVRHADGTTEWVKAEPLKDEGARFPQLGVAPPYRLTLLSVKRKGFTPTIPGSPAAEAKDPGFEPGDRIIGMTDPANPKEVTPLRDDPDPSIGKDINDYYRRMELLAGQPITFRVVRKDDGPTVDVRVQPAYRADLGVRMRMGRVAALRVGGPAEQARVVGRPADKKGVVASTDEEPTRGDRINSVELPEPNGRQTLLTADALDNKQSPNVDVRKLDPILLPIELKRWADRVEKAGTGANRTVKLGILRPDGHVADKPFTLEIPYDLTYRHDREVLTLPNSPLPLGGLGLAYWVDAAVDEVTPNGPAARLTPDAVLAPPISMKKIRAFLAGDELLPNDVITAIRFKVTDEDGNLKAGKWEDIKDNQWAWAESMFQSRPPFEVDLRVKRGDVVFEMTVSGRPNKNYPTDDRGLVFLQDFRTQKAEDIGDAIGLGAWRTVRFVKEVYMNLYAMIFGRVSAKTMSGPLTIANVSYKFAGEDFWQFLLFLGMISVNLAVVNFLPIPVLDGGHMVFLILEKILGRPVPERVFAFAMYTGLFLILALMIFVISLDVSRLFFD